MTLYDLKAKMATVGAQLQKLDGELVDKLANPSVPIAEIKDLKNQKADLQERFDSLKEAHDRMVSEQAAELKAKNPTVGATDDKERMIKAKAEFFRATLLGRPMSADVQNALIALPPGGGTGGEKFLPTTLVNELVHEPFTRNQMRNVVRVSAIKGLEIPKIAYKLDDDSFIGDAETAKEMKLEGDKVAFGRFKSKVYVSISDTVLHGSDLELVNYVENALHSGLAAKEKKVTFADANVVAAEKHMTFYQKDGSGNSVIKEVEGPTLLKAIKRAIADLHEDFRENAKVVMTYADYVEIIEDLANGNTTFYDAPPERIIGKPVIFSDSATTPIVGDFGYARLNYDPESTFDTDKDVKTGEYIWVLTAWFDQRILLKSAFRLAKAVPQV